MFKLHLKRKYRIAVAFVLLYAMLQYTAASPELPCGFLHLPCPDAAPGLSREALLRGLIAALRVLTQKRQ